MKKLFLLNAALSAFFFISCSSKAQFDDSLYEVLTGPSLVEKGKIVFDYSTSGGKNTRQFYCNRSEGIYRVGDDTMSEYFELRLEDNPSLEGQKIKGKLVIYLSSRQEVKNDLLFEVVRIDEEGQVWLWNQSSETVAVVAFL